MVDKLLESVKAFPETLKILLVPNGEYDDTAFYLAFKRGYVEVVDKLLESVKAYPDTLQAIVEAIDKYKQIVLDPHAEFRLKFCQHILDLLKAKLDTLRTLVVTTDNDTKTPPHLL
jgi:hypothetical protein